ncbi:hypothetical protein CSKR_107658 [Clonorchis sinensis]|uniref:Uncharacterized protein n=1 Tax=Clonorchis sinensis TaxID=79923 RepID=A0A3R7GFW7_CLOSI|nr:hypothetical protein CSKR_107658 [Clonorchis sinensis]
MNRIVRGKRLYKAYAFMLPLLRILIIIGIMTSVFNTDASLPHIHDFFESLSVKKRIKRVAPTTPKRFVISFIPLCQVKGWPPRCSRHSELGTENSTLFGKRWLGMCNTCPNQRSFWCWTHSPMKVPVAQPKTRFLIALLRLRRHQPTQAMVLRQGRDLALVYYNHSENKRLTGTWGLLLPDEPQERRNRSLSVEEFSATLLVDTLRSNLPHVSVGMTFEMSRYIFMDETTHKVAENSTVHDRFRPSLG